MTLTRVQHGNSGTTYFTATQLGGTGITYSPWASVTSGNFLVLGVTIYDATDLSQVHAVTIVDASGNTWHEGPHTNVAATAQYQGIWYCPNASSGSHSLTIKWTDDNVGSSAFFEYVEYGGTGATVTLHASATGSTASGTSWTTSNATTTVPCLLTGFWTSIVGLVTPPTLGAGSGWSGVDLYTHASSVDATYEDQGVGGTGVAAGTYAATGTATGASNNAAGESVIAAFSFPTAYTRSFASTVTPVDTVTRVLAAARSLSSAVAPITSFSRLVAAKRSFSSTVAPITSATLVRVLPRSFASSVTPGTALSRVAGSVRGLPSTVTPATTLSRLVAAQRSMASSVGAATLLSRVLASLRAFASAVTPATTLGGVRGVPRSFTTTVTPITVFAGQYGAVRVLITVVGPQTSLSVMGPPPPPAPPEMLAPLRDKPQVGAWPDYTIRVRDGTSFALVAEIDRYLLASYTRRFQAPGSFTLVVNRHQPAIGYLTKPAALIEFLRDGVSDFIGVVLHVQAGPVIGDRQAAAVGGGLSNIYGQDEASETWTISGIDLGHLANRRVALPFPFGTTDQSVSMGATTDDQLGVAADTALRHYVNANMIASGETARNYPFLRLGQLFSPASLPPVPGQLFYYAQAPGGGAPILLEYNFDNAIGGQIAGYLAPIYPSVPFYRLGSLAALPLGSLPAISYQARGEPVAQALTAICQQLSPPGGLAVGYQFRLDLGSPLPPYAGTVWFDVLLSSDRTEGNAGGYAPAVFNIDHDALRSFSYTLDGLNVVNAVYAAGQFSGATRDLVTMKTELEITLGLLPGSAAVGGGAWNGLNAQLSTTGPGSGLAHLADFNAAIAAVDASVFGEFVTDTSTNIWGRCEEWLNLPNATDTLQQAAQAELNAKQMLQTVQFAPLDTAALQYRRDWDLGDRVTTICEPMGIRLDEIIQEVTVTIPWPGSGLLYAPSMSLTVGAIPRAPLTRQIQDAFKKLSTAVAT